MERGAPWRPIKGRYDMDFAIKRAALAERNWNDPDCRAAVAAWHNASRRFDYQYMFEWLGRPIIQDPQDICAIQEVIWTYRPDVIIETGVARGGSLILAASILAAIGFGEYLHGETPAARKVIGIDIDIRRHNRDAIEHHALGPMIELVEGSSIAPEVVEQVGKLVPAGAKGMVLLDSNHTRDHVFSELQLYAPFVPRNSAIFVLDTGIEFAPVESFNVKRPWGPGNSPFNAVDDFLATEAGADFRRELSIEKRHLLTCAPQGLIVRR
jgi:cephalosporin hydroxylase